MGAAESCSLERACINEEGRTRKPRLARPARPRDLSELRPSSPGNKANEAPAQATPSRLLNNLNPSSSAWGSTPNAHCNFATYLKNVKKDYDGAEREYQEALRVDPKHAIAHLNYANFLTSIRGDHDGAQMHYEEAVKSSPHDTDAHYNFAVFLKNVRSDLPAAGREFREALRADAENVRAHISYASLLGMQGQLDDAEQHYHHVLQRSPDHDKALQGLMWIQSLRAQQQPQTEIRGRAT